MGSCGVPSFGDGGGGEGQWLQVSLTKYIRFYVFEDLNSQALEFEFWGVGNKIENPSP